MVHAGVRAWQRGGTGYWGWFCGTLTLILILGLAVLAGLGFDKRRWVQQKRTCRMSVAAVTVSCGQERPNHKPRVRERGTSGVPGSGVEVARRATGPRSQNSTCGGVSVGGHVRESLTSRRIGAGAWRSAPTRCLVRDGTARLVAYE